MNQPQGIEYPRAAIHQVSQKDGLATFGMGIERSSAERGQPGNVGRHLVTQSLQKLLELVATAVDVADDVERPVFLATVVPERHALDHRRLGLIRTLQHEDVAESLLAKTTERTL